MDGVYCTGTHGKNKTSDRWTVLEWLRKPIISFGASACSPTTT
jgi:hypothetical protein